MIVSETGEVLEPRVVESAGDVLDQAALDAIASWRFGPTRKGEEAVRVRWTVRQTFRFSRWRYTSGLDATDGVRVR